jgi:hypothetical protein
MPLAVFIEYAWLAAVIGAFFAVAGWRRHRRRAMAVGFAWALYAVYETGMHQRWLCTGECNIRVDLLLILPVLLLMSAGAVWSLARARP